MQEQTQNLNLPPKITRPLFHAHLHTHLQLCCYHCHCPLHHHHIPLHLFPHHHPHHHHHHQYPISVSPAPAADHNNLPLQVSDGGEQVTAASSVINKLEQGELEENLELEDEEGDVMFVMTDEWTEFFAKSEAKRRSKKQQKKGCK